MKTKYVFLTLTCLLFLAVMGNSQQTDQLQQDSERHKNILRSAWYSGGCMEETKVLLRDPEFRAALSISDTDYQEIQTNVHNAYVSPSEAPQYREAMQETEEARRASLVARNLNPDAPSPLILPTDDEEILEADKRFNEAAKRQQLVGIELSTLNWKRETLALDNALTPKIKQKIQEAQLAAMGEMQEISPGLFKALNLTDAQKREIERIKKELEPEFEKLCEIYANNAARIIEIGDAAMHEMPPLRISPEVTKMDDIQKIAQRRLDEFQKN